MTEDNLAVERIEPGRVRITCGRAGRDRAIEVRILSRGSIQRMQLLRRPAVDCRSTKHKNFAIIPGAMEADPQQMRGDTAGSLSRHPSSGRRTTTDRLTSDRCDLRAAEFLRVLRSSPTGRSERSWTDAIYGLEELYRVSGNPQYLRIAALGRGRLESSKAASVGASSIVDVTSRAEHVRMLANLRILEGDRGECGESRQLEEALREWSQATGDRESLDDLIGGWREHYAICEYCRQLVRDYTQG